MSAARNLFWWLLRVQLPVPQKITLVAMALHGNGLERIYPSLGRVGHFVDRDRRVIRRHVGDLVKMGLLIPREARIGGHNHATHYTIGIVALDRHVDRSIEPPDAIVSPALLKLILHADLKPHRKLLLWAIAMHGDREVSKEQLARTLCRSTGDNSLEQLRRDIAQLDADGLVERSSIGGRGRGMTFQVNVEALTAIALQNPRYQRPTSPPLPFPKTPGTDRTETPGTDRTETPGTNVLRSGTTIAGGSVVHRGTDRKIRSVVIAGDERPVDAVENQAPASPQADRRSARSTGWSYPGNLIYVTLRAECYEHLRLAVDREGCFDWTELNEFAKSWCIRHQIDRFALPGRRPESAIDLVARVVDDAIFLFEKHHGRQPDRRNSGFGGGAIER